MRRVSIFMPSFELGGVQTIMINIANGLSSKGHQVEFIVADASGPMRPKSDSSIKVLDCEKSRYRGDLKTVFALVKLMRYLKSEKPAVLLVAPGFASVISIIAKLLTSSNTSLIILIDDKLSLMKKRKLKHRLIYLVYRVFFRYADSFVMAHNSAAEDFKYHFKLDNRRIHTIYHPIVDFKLIDNTTGADEAIEVFAEKGDKIILSIGRLSEEKGQLNLLDAFRLLSRSRHSLKLVIVGDGRDTEKIKARIRAYGLEDSVLMYGYSSNPYRLLKSAEIFVSPSNTEAFGAAIVEALATGAKVVATDCASGGPSEILEQGLYGQLCPPNNPVALADALNIALSVPYNKKSAIARARQFTVEESINAYSRLIEDELR